MCSCVESLAKWFLLVTNSITFLAALVVLGVSIWILVDQPSFLKVLNVTDDVVGGFDELKIYQSATIVLLVVSILVLIVAFFGCCGAAQESRCLLATYFAFDILLLIGTAIAAYFVFTDDLDSLKKPFMEALKQYDDTSNNQADKTLVRAWDSFQQDFQCCGVESFKDWSEHNPIFHGPDQSTLYPDTNSKPDYNNKPSNYRWVPESCCDSTGNQQFCAQHPFSNNGLYAKGCFQMVVEQIEAHESIVGGIAIGIVVVMVINAIISIYMATCGYYYFGDQDKRPSKRHYRSPR